MNLEETLDKIVELSREELGIVRKRGEEKTAAREHGHDFHDMQRAADRLDHYAHQLRRLHDAEFGQNWRHESLQDTPRSSLGAWPATLRRCSSAPRPGLDAGVVEGALLRWPIVGGSQSLLASEGLALSLDQAFDLAIGTAHTA